MIVALLLPFLALPAAGCRSPTDRVYALPLERPPAETDWAGAPALRVQAAGGRTTRANETAVDADAVHRSTASCHHGTGAPPVDVEIRAFYTGARLYLRLSWTDPTLDAGPGWRWDGRAWRRRPPGQDGAAVLWGPDEPQFRCARACHLVDFRKAGPMAFVDYRMATPPAWGTLDLWVWKAGWGRVAGAADDMGLGPAGRQPDRPGERFPPNLAEDGGGGPLRVPRAEPGAEAPAFLDRGAQPGRDEVRAQGRWDGGRWEVTFSRALRGRDPGDVVLEPGGLYRVGLAFLDGVSEDHNAVPDPVRLWLVPRGRLVPGRERREAPPQDTRGKESREPPRPVFRPNTGEARGDR